MIPDLFIKSENKTINLKRDLDLNLEVTYNDKGDNTVTFQMCHWANRLPDLGSSIFLRDPTYGVFWSGFAEQPKIGGFFNKPSNITGNGWQHTLQEDGWNEKKKWAAGTPLTNMVFDALSICHNITGGIPLPGGLTTTQLPEDSPEFTEQTPEDVFNFVRNVFSYLGTPLVWQIKNNPLAPFADQPSLEMKFQDTSPRYRVRLTKNDNFEPLFAASTVWNSASVAYQNGLYSADQAVQPYTVIPRLRKKRVNANSEVNTIPRAQALVAYLISRNNTLRPINTTLELHCDTNVEALYPATPAGTIGDWPHHLIRPHFTIRILNSMTTWGQYKNIRDYYIVDVKHNFTSGMTSLTLGDPVFYDAFKLLESYNSNRANIPVESGIVNEPLRDADRITVYGPTGDGASPPTNGEGIVSFKLDPTGALSSLTDPTVPTARYGAGVDPRLILDYGVQVNFGREADSEGIKGFITVIPARILTWELYHTPPPDSITIPTDGLTIKLHNVYPFTAGNVGTIIGTATIGAGNAGATGTLTPVNFQQNGKVGVEVTAPSGVANSGFQISLAGKKIFPAVGINT